jgi:hypothetical protein
VVGFTLPAADHTSATDRPDVLSPSRVSNELMLSASPSGSSPEAVASNRLYIPNGQDTHIEAANWLRANTDRDDFVIANTPSRLPPEWPDHGDFE